MANTELTDVLVIDHDSEVGELVASVLTDAGLAVRTCAPDSAVEVFLANLPRVIVINAGLRPHPATSGLVRTLLRLARSTPLLVLSTSWASAAGHDPAVEQQEMNALKARLARLLNRED